MEDPEEETIIETPEATAPEADAEPEPFRPQDFRVKKDCIFNGQLRRYKAGERLDPSEPRHNVEIQHRKLEPAN